jgi:hypothetical protein
LRPTADRFRSSQAQKRAESFASGQKGIAHCLGQTVGGFNIGNQFSQIAVDPVCALTDVVV